MRDENEFNVWIGCYACYNNGDLTGQWYPAIEAGEITTQQIHKAAGITTDEQGYVKGQEVYGPHEELNCFDIENAPKGYDKEMSPETAQKVAERIEELDGLDGNMPVEAFLAWCDAVGEDFMTADESDAEDKYRGERDSFREYADEWADEMIEQYGQSDYPYVAQPTKAKEEMIQWFTNYFDYEHHAREMRQGFTVLDNPEGGVWIFSD